MLISCEKCSTTYVLDEALIPPQGAPVQCTRCGHVFTAKPPAPAEITAGPTQSRPVPPWENPDLQNKPANSTLVFGAATGQPAPPPKSANQTMVFGASNAPPAAPPARGNQNQTMVFGAAPVGAPTAAPPKEASSAPKPNQTMVFGASAVGAPTAPKDASSAPKPNQTMVFGTAAANAAAQAPIAPPASKQTMVFGNSPAAPAPSSAPKPNQTMVFGTAAANNAARPAPPPAVAPNAAQTMVFGTSRAAPPTTPAAPAVEPAPAKNQTMMFGRTPAAKPIPKVTVGSAEAAGYAAGEDAQPTETQRVDLETVEPPAAEEPIEARHDRTQRYAMTESGGAEGPVPGSVEDRHNRTVLFAMNPMQETTKPDAVAPGAERAATPVPAEVGDASQNETLMFAGRTPPENSVAVEHTEPVPVTPPEGTPSVEFAATTLPNLSGIGSGVSPQLMPLSLELPPEPSFMPGAEPATDSGNADADIAALRSASNRRTTIAVIVFLVIALALGLTLVWYLFGRAMVTKESSAVRQKTQEALTTLRLDDASSQARAIEELSALVKAHGDSLEARSALVVALSVSVDDARAELARRERVAKSVQELLKGATPDERPALDEKLTRSRLELTTAREASDRLTAELAQALAGLQTQSAAKDLNAEQSFEVFRGQALAASVLGETEAITLAEKVRQTGHPADSWAELVLPEYAINGGSSFDDALKQLQLIQARDNTFLRAYVLAARINLRQGASAKAEEDLNRVLTLHPEHDAAKRLHELVASQSGE